MKKRNFCVVAVTMLVAVLFGGQSASLQSECPSKDVTFRYLEEKLKAYGEGQDGVKTTTVSIRFDSCEMVFRRKETSSNGYWSIDEIKVPLADLDPTSINGSDYFIDFSTTNRKKTISYKCIEESRQKDDERPPSPCIFGASEDRMDYRASIPFNDNQVKPRVVKALKCAAKQASRNIVI